MKKELQEELLSISPTRLTQLVIRVESRMMLAGIIYMPRTFEDVRSNQFEFMAKGYFVQTLSKQWLEEIPRRIRKWKNIITEFNNEFNGNQRYYAVCKKLKSVEEYGPETYDLDENGELLWADGSKIPDRNLESSTVLNDLYLDECRDIIQDFIPDDISHICSDVRVDASMDFRDIFAGITDHIPDSYIFDGHGNIRKATFEEHEMLKAVRGANAVELTDVLVLLAETMYRMCIRLYSWLKQKTINDDIAKDLNVFLCDCEKIENLELTETDVIQDYFKKEEELL